MAGSQPGRGTGLVLVSHSAALASGLADLAGQMAPDVVLRPAGGTSDGRLGTGFDVVEAAVQEVLEAGCSGVVVLADLGSARMTAEAVLDLTEDPRLHLATGAFVEGTVAGAVAAQTGADAAGVVAVVARTTRELADQLPAAGAPLSTGGDAEDAGAIDPLAGTELDAAADAGPATDGEARATVTVVNPEGLHARPAALLARQVAEFDAAVTLDGVDASSLLSLMGLGLAAGATAQVVATGPQAAAALASVVAAFEDGFGEL
ncbi:MAG: hypothetical protein BGO96_08735 [Micrococcales bacterium 73-15]|uniref:dihydroxyacetone kinase phosphoryl donor subunit DhaM n=1 Tax=Salana multivorans TaxID=120377 RepID=UPI00095E7A79|nr:dihydroxyacetone kinase phosphoryl donor subunit DhaM [Salana multivorans]OJX95692.1 MAG: hypothetical protein BGO96_08735 [Micrococcales bacterium 73-15]